MDFPGVVNFWRWHYAPGFVFLEDILSLLPFFVESLCFYLPALVANLGVYLIASGLGNDLPFDLGASIGKRRMIGNSRSMGGVLAWLMFATLVGTFQGRLLESVYLGLGGNFGTMLNSFIKRRLAIGEGRNFVPLDQTDFILGASLFYILAYDLSLSIFVGGLIIGGAIHVATNFILRKRWERINYLQIKHRQ